MKKTIFILILSVAVSGCGNRSVKNANMSEEFNSAWQEKLKEQEISDFIFCGYEDTSKKSHEYKYTLRASDGWDCLFGNENYIEFNASKEELYNFSSLQIKYRDSKYAVYIPTSAKEKLKYDEVFSFLNNKTKQFVEYKKKTLDKKKAIIQKEQERAQTWLR